MPLHNQSCHLKHQDQLAFSFQTADFVHISEKSEQELLLFFFIVSRSVPQKKSFCVQPENILQWAFHYLTFQRCCSSFAPQWLCVYVFPVGCSLNSESYLAAQTAVGVTEVESLPCINQKPAPRRDVSGLWLWRTIHLWLTHGFSTQISSLVSPSIEHLNP